MARFKLTAELQTDVAHWDTVSGIVLQTGVGASIAALALSATTSDSVTRDLLLVAAILSGLAAMLAGIGVALNRSRPGFPTLVMKCVGALFGMTMLVGAVTLGVFAAFVFFRG
jgi:hypothetical protein